jgi:hypothetical protein
LFAVFGCVLYTDEEIIVFLFVSINTAEYVTKIKGRSYWLLPDLIVIYVPEDPRRTQDSRCLDQYSNCTPPKYVQKFTARATASNHPYFN